MEYHHETSAGGICTVGGTAVVVVRNKTGGDANTAVGTVSVGGDGLTGGTPSMGILVAGIKLQAGLGTVDAVGIVDGAGTVCDTDSVYGTGS